MSTPTDPTTPLTLSVIAPCFNEKLNIPVLVERVLGVLDQGQLAGELVLVDDGSADGTGKAIEGFMDQHPGRVVGCFHDRNRGIAAAWKTGVAAARGKYVCIIDADLQYRPEDILRLHRTLIESSVDIVQGWRSAVGREKGARYNLSRGLNTILNTAFKMDLHDNKSGFAICGREVMQDLLDYEGNYYFWQSFIMVAAHAKGYSYKDIEILFENRQQGTSFLDQSAYRASLVSFVDIGKALWEYRIFRRVPDVATYFLKHHPVVDRTPKRSAVREIEWRTYMVSFNRSHKMLTRDVEHYCESLNKTQWLAPGQLKELQDEKLRRLIRHAYRNVPFYRARMREAGLHPDDIRKQEDLQKLPLLSKQDVREHRFFDMMSENHNRSEVTPFSTCGNTGEPVVCYADRAQLEFRFAAMLRCQQWTGYRFGDSCVRLWPPQNTIEERLDSLFLRRKFIPTFGFDSHQLARMVCEISNWNPTLIDGYAEVFVMLARHIQEHGGLVNTPRSILTGGQGLTSSQRQVIERAFGCALYDEYGSGEFAGVACECEAHEGHHINAEGFIVELLREGVPAKSGEVGEVVITDLCNQCMPFIRYRIGDKAVALDNSQTCACGRGLPRIGDIEGRLPAIIEGVDGRYLPGTYFTHYLKEFDRVFRRYQVVQHEPGAMTFRLVKGLRFSNDVLDQVLTAFRKRLGEKMQIDVDWVELHSMDGPACESLHVSDG